MNKSPIGTQNLFFVAFLYVESQSKEAFCRGYNYYINVNYLAAHNVYV